MVFFVEHLMKIHDFGCTSIYGNPHLDDFYGCVLQMGPGNPGKTLNKGSHNLDVGIMVIHRWICSRKKGFDRCCFKALDTVEGIPGITLDA
jgi:hypothetical protein